VLGEVKSGCFSWETAFPQAGAQLPGQAALSGAPSRSPCGGDGEGDQWADDPEGP